MALVCCFVQNSWSFPDFSYQLAVVAIPQGFDGDSFILRKLLAYCGYYDLAHMASDFRNICGFSPSELIRHGGKLTETFGQKYSGLMRVVNNP